MIIDGDVVTREKLTDPKQIRFVLKDKKTGKFFRKHRRERKWVNDILYATLYTVRGACAMLAHTTFGETVTVIS